MGNSERKPLQRPQTADEMKFYARNHLLLTIFSTLAFLPLGALGLYFSYQTNEANRCSDWKDAYQNSTRTLWVDVLAILAFLGVLYIIFLVL